MELKVKWIKNDRYILLSIKKQREKQIRACIYEASQSKILV